MTIYGFPTQPTNHQQHGRCCFLFHFFLTSSTLVHKWSILNIDLVFISGIVIIYTVNEMIVLWIDNNFKWIFFAVPAHFVCLFWYGNLIKKKRRRHNSGVIIWIFSVEDKITHLQKSTFTERLSKTKKKEWLRSEVKRRGTNQSNWRFSSNSKTN